MCDAPLLICAATPKRAQVLRAGHWPQVDGQFGREEIARAVIEAVETAASDAICNVIAAGVSLLLGEQGRRAHLREVKAIRKHGNIPLLLFMLVDADTMVATVAEVPRPTIH